MFSASTNAGAAMANAHTVHQLIADIQALRQRLRESRAEKDVAYVVTYLLANRPLIESCLDVVRETTTEADRKALQAVHPALDFDPVPDGWWEHMPRAAITDASSYYVHLTETIEDDSLHMLKRALEYAAYCPQLQREFKLLLSPA